VSSPRHPETYDTNLNCEWVIRVPPQDRYCNRSTSWVQNRKYNRYSGYGEKTEGLGESQFRREDIHCGTLDIYVLCGHSCLVPEVI